MTLSIKVKKRYLNSVTILLSVLPLVDSLNGYWRTFPIGVFYKAFLCIMLFINILRKGGKIRRQNGLILSEFVAYMLGSILINVVILNGKIINFNYPVKLIFNVIFMILLIENINNRCITGEIFFDILDLSSWLMIVCYLTPYIMGLGNNVYVGDIGYKAFFVAQNELGFVLVVMSFFTSYKLSCCLNVLDLIKMSLLILCGMLLNTKTSTVASLIAVGCWLVPMVIKSGIKVKVISVAVSIVGVFLLKNNIYEAVSNIINRFSILQSRYYAGSVLAGLLSGRNYYIKNAWKYLCDNYFGFRFFFGNGFCSSYLVEMDFFDIFFYLGLIGVIIVVIFIIWIYRLSVRNAKNDKSSIRTFSYILIVFIAVLTGHVLFMAMSGSFFVIYCCFLIYYQPRITKC